MPADERFARDLAKVGPLWVVLPNWNGARWLPECLGTLGATVPPEVSILVVDNGSSDDSVALARAVLPRAEVLAVEENIGFVRGANLGMSHALERGARSILLLNNDVRLREGWFEPLVAAAAEFADVAILGPLQRDYDGHPSPRTRAAVRHWTRGLAKGRPDDDHARLIETDWVEGSCMLIRREVVERIGWFDSIFSPAYFEEVDFCRRARRAGFSIGLVLGSTIDHHGAGASLEGRSRSLQRSLVERNYVLFHASAPRASLADSTRTLATKAVFHGVKQILRGKLSVLEWLWAMAGVPRRIPALFAKVRRDRAGRACPIGGDRSVDRRAARVFEAALARDRRPAARKERAA